MINKAPRKEEQRECRFRLLEACMTDSGRAAERQHGEERGISYTYETYKWQVGSNSPVSLLTLLHARGRIVTRSDTKDNDWMWKST